MNKRQEILLWMSGLIFSWWIYLRLNFYLDSKINTTLFSEEYKNHGTTMNVWMYSSGKLDYAIPMLMQLGIPLLIITILLYVSLRTRQ